jgi:hypothetical protein
VTDVKETLKPMIEERRRSDPHQSFYYHSRVSTDRRYLCMTIPKIACTTIKTTLHQFESGEPPGPLGNIHEDEEGKRLSDFTTDEIADILTAPGWFRFCFVRNPYHRLFSAYKSKICNAWEKQYRWMQDEVREAFDYPVRDGRRAGMVAFRDFVGYLETASDKVRHDGHLNVQTNILMLDLVQYDFVGRFESFAADFGDVLKRLNAPPEIHSVAAEVRNPTVKVHLAVAYDRELADRVYKMYEPDFTGFGYDRDSWMFDSE